MFDKLPGIPFQRPIIVQTKASGARIRRIREEAGQGIAIAFTVTFAVATVTVDVAVASTKGTAVIRNYRGYYLN
jgi:hypothetical protein